MNEIDIKMTQEDLLIIIGSLVKEQMSRGVKEQKILDLLSRLSLQAIDKVDFKEVNKELL